MFMWTSPRLLKGESQKCHYSYKHARLGKLQGQMPLDKVNTAFTRPHYDRDRVMEANFVVAKS